MSMIGNGVFDKSEKYAIKLEGGTSVVRFYKSRRSEKGKLSIRVQTGHIIWESSQSKDVEIITSLYDIKEVRRGKGSCDFEKWSDDAQHHDDHYCFVAFYGADFKLKTLSIVALSESERELWMEGLDHLVKRTHSDSYITQLLKLLHTEFITMENKNNLITLKDIIHQLS